MTWLTGCWRRNVDHLAGRWVTAALAGLCLILLAGCGYTHRTLYPQHIRTVSVDIFENQSFYRGVEFDLTEAVIKEIELRTPYKVVASDRADTIVRGSIVRVDQRVLSRQRAGGLPQDLEMLLVIDFEWQDLRSGQTLRQRSGLEVVGRYVPARPVAESFASAQHQAAARAAGELVKAMRGQW